MIGRVNGVLLRVSPPQVVVDTVSGIGYEIDIPLSDLARLPSVGAQVILHTHLSIREDAHNLYGFLELETRDTFRQLIKVSGIGPKIALATLSTLAPTELMVAIADADIAMLCRVPGIGKKMAERMILELKGKFDKFISGVIIDGSATPRMQVDSDLKHALASLGYNDKEIGLVLKEMPTDIGNLSLAIKEALKLLNKRMSL